MLLNYGVGKDSWESLGQQGDPTSPSLRKSVLNIHWKDWCWSWNSSTLATWWEEGTHLKRPMLRMIEGKRKGTTEDELVRWHHRFNGLELEQTPGFGDGQGSLVCYSPWGQKELDRTEQLNWTRLHMSGFPVLHHFQEFAQNHVNYFVVTI